MMEQIISFRADPYEEVFFQKTLHQLRNLKYIKTSVYQHCYQSTHERFRLTLKNETMHLVFKVIWESCVP